MKAVYICHLEDKHVPNRPSAATAFSIASEVFWNNNIYMRVLYLSELPPLPYSAKTPPPPYLSLLARKGFGEQFTY